MKNGHRCLLITILMMSTFLFGGCSSFNSKDNGTPSNPPEVVNGAKEQAYEVNPALARTETLVVTSSNLSLNFHPLYATRTTETWVRDLVFEGLMSHDKMGNPIPLLAESYEISEDGLEYTFIVKDDLLFHDGSRLKMSDVMFSYEILANEQYSGEHRLFIDGIVGVMQFRSGEATNISGIEIIGEKTIKFRFETPGIYNVWGFESPIIPEHVYSFSSWDNFLMNSNNPIGTGPMALVAAESDQQIELKRSAFHHGMKSNVSRVIIKAMSPQLALESFANGSVDIVAVSPTKEHYDKLKAITFAEIVEFPSNAFNYIGINHNHPILKDKKVRQALAYAFDRDEFIRTQWQNHAIPSNSPVPETHWTYPNEQALNIYSYDIEKAKILLSDAGWIEGDDKGVRMKDGERLELTISAFSDISWSYNLANATKAQWEKIGAIVNVEFMDFNMLKEKVFTDRSAMLWVMAWHLPVDYDPARLYGTIATGPGGFNAGNYYNTNAEELFVRLRTAFDDTERINLVSDWISLANEELPYIYIAQLSELWGVNERVQKIEIGPYSNWVGSIQDIVLRVME
ncbi:MAG: hypothetical protein IBX70_06490 [Clostridia bacterium]|nr:hypothetical protein [Clostridia bacterium]